jgi:hypothetical protein
MSEYERFLGKEEKRMPINSEKTRRETPWKYFFTILVTAALSIAITLAIQDIYGPSYMLPGLNVPPCKALDA